MKQLSNALIILATATFVVFLCIIASPDAKLQPLSWSTAIGMPAVITILSALGIVARFLRLPKGEGLLRRASVPRKRAAMRGAAVR
jgi:hypothetical protein